MRFLMVSSTYFIALCGQYKEVTVLTFRIAAVCVVKAFKL